MKMIARQILRLMAKTVLWKYHPVIVGVTGSVGKTTTKDAIVYLLSPHMSVRGSERNFNNEIGLPLTILGQETPGRSFLKWMRAGIHFLEIMLFRRDYPKVLVLEMGVDRPGDMQYLLSIVRPDIAVVTEISSSHIEFFGSLDAIAQEKGALVESIGSDGYAILNADDARVWKMRKRTASRFIGYGFHRRSMLRAFNDSVVCGEKGLCGMRFKIEYDGKTLPIRLKNLIARHHLYAVLAALAVSDILKVPLLEAVRSAEQFRLSPGRLQPIRGVRGSWIFDDTYNASSSSMIAAISTIEQIPFGRKFFVLGDMLELGSYEIEGHTILTKPILRIKTERIVLVGRRMKILFDALLACGCDSQRISIFDDPVSAGKFLAPLLEQEDVVLVKGSQGMRMELAVEEIMAEKSQAQKLLCRQSERWKEIPYKQP